MTAPYRSREKISVTLTLIPSAITAVIAGSPARVAGILISTFGRSTILASSLACAMVAAVSWASRGSTSMDTRPSTWPLVWKIGVNRSAASRTSSVVISRTASSTLAPRAASSATCLA